MRFLLIIIMAVFLDLTSTLANAYNFYGASISDDEVPSYYMKFDIYGYRPTIKEVVYNSPAEKAGLKRGDIFISINGINIKKTIDISVISTKPTALDLLRNNKRILIDVDFQNTNTTSENISTEMLVHKSTTRTDELPYLRPDTRSTLKFDDTDLERKFGKSTPAELAKQKQVANKLKMNQEREDLIERTKLENKRNEWNVVGYKNYPKAVRVILGAGGHLQCQVYAPAPYYYEYCTINFKNGVESRLDCYDSSEDLLEVPNQLRQNLRDSLRKSYCTYRTIGATSYGPWINGHRGSCQ